MIKKEEIINQRVKYLQTLRDKKVLTQKEKESITLDEFVMLITEDVGGTTSSTVKDDVKIKTKKEKIVDNNQELFI